MSKLKLPSSMINDKFPNTFEICVTYRLFIKQEHG